MVHEDANHDTIPFGDSPEHDTLPYAAEPPEGGKKSPDLHGDARPIGSFPPRQGQLLQGRYTYCVRSILGDGAFGCVLLAEVLAEAGQPHPLPSHPLVALKAYRTNLPIDPVLLVKREVNALLSIKCDRVAQVLDYSLESSPSFLVMPYHGRGSLDRKPLRPLEPATAARLLRDILVALVHAHRASILHLDIKPANILMDDEGGFVLADFGIAHAQRAAWSMVGPSLGTRGYQAPEQREFAERSIGTPTDLFGLGASLWALLVGADPCLDSQLYSYRAAGESGFAFPHVSGLSKTCPPPLADLVMRMISLDPKMRPGSAAEALSEVQSIMTGQLDWGATHDLRLPEPEAVSEAAFVAAELFDPFWRGVFNVSSAFRRLLRPLSPGECLTSEGMIDPRAFILLRGAIEVSRSGALLNVEEREGTIMGDVSALTGLARTASLRSRGESWVAEFNAAQLEELAATHPAVAIRMIKDLAERLARESALAAAKGTAAG